MKLWHKIFLCAFAVVLIGIEGIELTVLTLNHRANLESAKQQAVVSHQYITTGLSNKILYQRMKEQKTLLLESELNNMIYNAVLENAAGTDGVYIERKNKKIVSFQWKMPDGSSNLKELVKDTEKIWCSVKNAGGKPAIITASVKVIEGREYKIYCQSDASKLYTMFDSQLRMAQYISAITAAVLGVLLLIIVRYFLLPLKRINRMIQRIASGDYKKRIKSQGSKELQELSENINQMADSVEKNDLQLRQIAQGRKQFIDSFAHEMKTPLTSILGFADILRLKKEITAAQRQEYAGIIVDETKRLKKLSDKLLQISVTEHTNLELTEIYIPDLFEEINETVSLIMKEKEIIFETESEDIIISADKELFTSLLLNFIDNARKASDKGSKIQLKAFKESDKVHITVKDFGMGMTEEQLRHITEPFYMADKSRSRKSGGAGLGLALCAEIIKKHDMKFFIESEFGKGTKVHMIIPESQVKKL